MSQRKEKKSQDTNCRFCNLAEKLFYKLQCNIGVSEPLGATSIKISNSAKSP